MKTFQSEWCALCRRPQLRSQRAKASFWLDACISFLIHPRWLWKECTSVSLWDKMDCSTTVTLMNLPDELILAICSQMDTLDVLYSFIGVNERFTRLTRDRNFTQSIELMKRNDDETTRLLPDLVLDRFCRQILPKIHTLVESLSVESSVAERSLSAGHYPKLRTLTLADIDENFAARHFTGTKILVEDEFHRYLWFRELHICSSFPKSDLVTDGHHCRSSALRIHGGHH